MKTLAFTRVGKCSIFVSGKHPLDNEEWEKYLEFLSQFPPGTSPVCLIYTEATGPTAEQRMRVNEVLLPIMKEIKVAVLLSSAISRGITTALSWIHPVYHTFHHNQVDEAIAFLEIPSEDVPRVKELLVTLKDELTRP